MTSSYADPEDDPLYDPDTEIDLNDFDADDLQVLHRIWRKRDLYYTDIPEYLSITDRRRFEESELRRWAHILDKYIRSNGIDSKLIVYSSDSTHIKKVDRVSRVVMLFAMNKMLHEIVVDFNTDFNTIRVYDSSGIIEKPEELWDAFASELNASWKRYIGRNFDKKTARVSFAPITHYNDGKFFPGHCTAFSAWVALYLVLNPDTTAYMGNVPAIPGHDAVSFYKYVRTCNIVGRLILPDSYKVYVGFGKRNKRKNTFLFD